MSRSRRPVDSTMPDDMARRLGNIAQFAAGTPGAGGALDSGHELIRLLSENGFDLHASAAKESSSLNLTEEERRRVRTAAIAGSNEVESLIRIIERLSGERFLP